MAIHPAPCDCLSPVCSLEHHPRGALEHLKRSAYAVDGTHVPGPARDRRPSMAPVDPQLRGRVTPRVIRALESRGLRIHRIGRAIYLHDATRSHHWILAVVDHDGAPAWILELDDHHRWIRGRGEPTARRARAIAARVAAWRRARIRDEAGRFVARPEWWQDDAGRPLEGLRRPGRLS